MPQLFLALLIGLLATPTLASADEHEPRAPTDHQEIARGLAAGIKALHEIGGQEKTIRHLQSLLRGQQKAGKGNTREKRKRGPQAAKRDLAEMVEVMWMAQEVLREEERHEAADILKRSVMALKMMWADRADDEAMAALLDAPGQKEQIKSLLLARKVLAKRGDKRRAKAVQDLGKELARKSRPAGTARKTSKVRKATRKTKDRDSGARERPVPRRVDDEGDEELGELEGRLRVLRLAMPALREGERRDAAELLERAIRTAEFMLVGREDEKAQRIYRQTPGLSELSEVLHLAARLWLDFEHLDEAEAVARLSRYYRERAQQAPEEPDRAEGAAEHDPERARARTWAKRQQEEMEERRARAREVEMQAERRREHEKRVRENTRRRMPTHEGHEHEGRRSPDERIEDLRRELDEVQRALRTLMRQLRELSSER